MKRRNKIRKYYNTRNRPLYEGSLAAGNLKVEGNGSEITVNAGSGHYNGIDSIAGTFTKEDAEAFENGMRQLLESRGFKVKGVSATQYFPGKEPPQ